MARVLIDPARPSAWRPGSPSRRRGTTEMSPLFHSPSGQTSGHSVVG